MSTSRRDARVLLIGAGGVASPAILALVRAGVRHLFVADDDVVDVSNLARQILYTAGDVGTPKLDALARAVAALDATVALTPIRSRFLPENARSLVDEADVVLDGSDNFATRFLTADACVLARRPVVHAAAVRWNATVFVSGANGARPCYRCLFEDLPDGLAPDCASAGVVGPVCGVAGGVAADLVVRLVEGDEAAVGTVTSFDGRTDVLRRIPVPRRLACPACGERPTIHAIDRARYVAPTCDL